MSRPLRIEFEGALYHVTVRGDRGEAIFHDDVDRRQLLATIAHSVERFDAVVFAYCLMGNHFHLVARTHRPNLSRLMQHINGVFTQRYNRRHQTKGHLFQGRFHAILVDQSAYFLEVCRYVDLNPVRAGIARRPQEWPWSSYRAHTGRIAAPAWLDSATLYSELAVHDPQLDGPAAYARFVSDKLVTNLWETALRGQIYLGDDAFIRRIQKRAKTPIAHDVPRAQRKPPARAMRHYLESSDRDTAIARAYLEGGHTQPAIARATSLSVARISRLIAAYEAKGKT